MLIHWTFTGCDDSDEREIAKCWQEQQMAIEGKLAALPIDPSELRLGVYYESAAEEWEFQAALHVGNRTLVSEASADRMMAAMEGMVRGLVRKIDRVEDHSGEEIVHEQHGMEAVEALLARNRSAGRSDSFFSFLWPVLRSLRTFTRRELEAREMEGQVSAEQLNVSDALDEAMVRAWDRFTQRPRGVPLDQWLRQLIQEALSDLVRGNGHESLDDSRPVPTVPAGDDGWEELWADLMDLPEVVERGDGISGAQGADAWDDVEVDEKHTALAEMLGEIPRTQRQALIYYVVEGREPGEIADLQGRDTEAVSNDIRAAWRTLAHDEAVLAGLLGVEHNLDRNRRSRGHSRKRRR